MVGSEFFEDWDAPPTRPVVDEDQPVHILPRRAGATFSEKAKFFVLGMIAQLFIQAALAAYDGGATTAMIQPTSFQEQQMEYARATMDAREAGR